jgi:hypothetical protein
VSLPRHLLEILDPARRTLPRPRPYSWRTLYPNSGPSTGLPIVELRYDIEIPAWNEGPYRQDVPK